MTTKIKDLAKIIEIQEKIIKANKKENDILEDCLKKWSKEFVYDKWSRNSKKKNKNQNSENLYEQYFKK